MGGGRRPAFYRRPPGAGLTTAQGAQLPDQAAVGCPQLKKLTEELPDAVAATAVAVYAAVVTTPPASVV